MQPTGCAGGCSGVFTNSGLVCGAVGVNLSDKPYENWIGYIGACSNYGSFSYL